MQGQRNRIEALAANKVHDRLDYKLRITFFSVRRNWGFFINFLGL